MAGARMVCMTDAMPQIDALDARLLLALDADPFATVVALAQRLGVARNTVQTRLRRLDASGALAEVTRRVTPEALGFSLTAFLTVSIRQGQHDEALAGLRAVRRSSRSTPPPATPICASGWSPGTPPTSTR